MQRKLTGQTRGANAIEGRFIKWCKEQRCCVCCADPAHTEVDHIYGSTYRHNKVLIGHWLVIPLCRTCHQYKTRSRKFFIEQAGEPLILWQGVIKRYGKTPPDQELQAINSLIKQLDWVDA